MMSYDVGVIGAGPAGAVAARELARRGMRVLLLDKAQFPRDKVCGCCLNGNALSALETIGLGSLPQQLGGVPLRSMHVSSGVNAVMPLRTGIALSRRALDQFLIEAAIREGAIFRPNTTASLQDTSQEKATIRAGSEVIAIRTAILADGLNSQGTGTTIRRASLLGAGAILESPPAFYKPGIIYMAVGREGYVGLVILEDGRLDIAAAMHPWAVKKHGGIAGVARQISHSARWPALPETTWKGTPLLTRRAQRIAGPRWFAIGDATGYIEPFTGEGMAWAITSAVAVAPIVAKGHPNAAREWTREHQRIIRARQWTCRLLANGLRSSGLTTSIIRLLSFWPGIAQPFIRSLNRPSRFAQE